MTHSSDLCQTPPALSEDDLFAAIDGIAGAIINSHLAICGYCARRKENLAREMQTLQGGLTAEMFRQGCPDADTLAMLMRQCGFTNVRYHRMTFGIVALHIGVKPPQPAK